MLFPQTDFFSVPSWYVAGETGADVVNGEQDGARKEYGARDLPHCAGTRIRLAQVGMRSVLSSLSLAVCVTYLTHLRRDFIHRCHICIATVLASYTEDGPGNAVTVSTSKFVHYFIMCL